MNKFEKGKFYYVQISGVLGLKIPALCTRVTKCTVTFQYICKTETGFEKRVVQRRKGVMLNGLEFAFCPGIWSGIYSTYAWELGNKPKMWEDVK